MQPSKKQFALALASLVLSGAAAARPAAAQDLVYKLSGVKFSDGATATGYFVYNPTANAFGDYRIQTAGGSANSSGDEYSPATKGPKAGSAGSSMWRFTGNSFTSYTQPYHTLVLATNKSVTLPGKYPLTPGTDVTPTSFSGSGEALPASRGIARGYLVVTAAAAPSKTSP